MNPIDEAIKDWSHFQNLSRGELQGQQFAGCVSSGRESALVLRSFSYAHYAHFSGLLCVALPG